MPEHQDPKPLTDQAIRWWVRLRGEDCTVEERARFEAWLAGDDAHRRAFARVCAQWAWMEPFKAMDLPERTLALAYRPPLRRYRGHLGFGLAALLLLALGLTATGPSGWHGSGAEYATQKGERQAVALADGSLIEINTDTALRVRLSRWGRAIELLHGEVLFTVAPDPERLFEVEAGRGRVRALGTVFTVYRAPDRVLVAVLEGQVEVQTDTPRTLAAGESLAYGMAGEALPAEPPDLAALTAWREGRLVFRARRLDEVCAELSRYHDTRVRVLDPALGARRVSGTFRTTDLDPALAAIARTLKLAILHPAAREVMLARRRGTQ